MFNLLKNKFIGNDFENFEISGGSSVTINGKTYCGNNITMKGNTVIVDGKKMDDFVDKNITISIDGNVGSIKLVSGQITALDVGDIETTSGNINCQHVDGDVVSVNGDITCGNILGSVKTVNGDVKAKTINGKVHS